MNTKLLQIIMPLSEKTSLLPKKSERKKSPHEIVSELQRFIHYQLHYTSRVLPSKPPSNLTPFAHSKLNTHSLTAASPSRKEEEKNKDMGIVVNVVAIRLPPASHIPSRPQINDTRQTRYAPRDDDIMESEKCGCVEQASQVRLGQAVSGSCRLD